ncbi:helix-turn-helix domain-containing protein [Microbacterium sp. SORGH_AS_0888]|uniref:helix-turn-helix domain-containing protein n=1 Tax=Microbacterium sp. SORGH_AS_0888 TaxID=3041791 RepID=UPI00278778ED|nr:helix-turn-helix transcriptional regulator [Microbacterium sp. SORGH_AS_0888]MDQ1129425.1 transcriptional regulator with XRE-family HTH domain [Microbacterium sp. SORGH_AS_0888]
MPTEADHQRRKGDVARRVAEVLRQARMARGMSQEEVANAARISVFAYGCLERGRGTAGGDANPTLDTVVRVFAVLGIDVYEWNAVVPPLEPPAHGGSN